MQNHSSDGQRNGRTGFRICQCMVMASQVVSASGSGGGEIIGFSRPSLARCDAGAMELIVRVIHLIDTKNGFQAAFVEGFVVSH